MLAAMTPYAQGSFDTWITPAMLGLGILIGALVVVFVVGALWGGLKLLYYLLMINWSLDQKGYMDQKYDLQP